MLEDPVTVFMLVVAGLLVVGGVGEQVFARTGVPAVIWLILLGVGVRAAGIVPVEVVAGLAPFFAALALVLILFDAGQHLTLGTGVEALSPTIRRRALLLALLGFAGTMLLVALLSMGLYGLNVLPVWSWTHAFMLGSLMSAGAGEVFMPSLQAHVDAPTLALLKRESSITKALAVAGTVLFIDLLSPQIAAGGAPMAMAFGFGFAALFGIGIGVGWMIVLQNLAGNPRSYMYTLAAMILAYVMSETTGGSGPLTVLVFGVILGNAERLLALLVRKKGASEPVADASSFQAALADHDATIQFVRTLVFTMVGLLLAGGASGGPLPWGPLVFGVAIGFLPLIVRLLAVRFVLSSSKHAERAAVGNCAPRGMATVALATLPLVHAVPGSASLLTLVFSAVTTSVVIFTIGQWHRRVPTSSGELAEKTETPPAPPVMRPLAPALSHSDVRAPTLPERRDVNGDTGKQAPVATPSRTVVNEAVDPGPLLAVATPLITTAPASPVVVASEPVKGRTLVAELPVPVSAPVPAPVGKIVEASRGPLVGMQEAPAGKKSGPVDREFAVMPTLPTIDAARAHGENPLDSAMMRALSKRPEDVNPRGGRVAAPEGKSSTIASSSAALSAAAAAAGKK